MASTINATTSGVVTTGDSVATLSLQTGGTTAVAIDTAQNVALSKGLALLGSSSGSVTLAAPATAGTQSYTLPTAQPTADGFALTSTKAGTMSWAAASATPAGSDTQVQYNNGGTAFGAASTFTFNNSTGVVTATGFTGAHNGTVGAGTPSTGSFTTLAASSTVSGTGFSTYLASPPAIGATAAAAGTFTQGSFSSTVHRGSTSGTVTLAAPATAGTQSYTLPTAQPTANGQALTATTAGVMSWATAGGGGTPGGSDTQVQYNNVGAFGGISGFTTDGTRVTASTTIGVGAATPSTSGAGITFPATQSDSSNLNTLDDYEEGTWTPGFAFGGGTTGITYSEQNGNYTKIGGFVFASYNISISSKGSSSGQASLTGLPFANGSTAGKRSGGFLSYCANVTFVTGQPFFYLGNSQTAGILFTGANTSLTDTALSNTTQLIGYFVYQV